MTQFFSSSTHKGRRPMLVYSIVMFGLVIFLDGVFAAHSISTGHLSGWGSLLAIVVTLRFLWTLIKSVGLKTRGLAPDFYVTGEAAVYGDAKVSDPADYIVFKNFWSHAEDFITWTRSDDMWTYGNFHGTGKEFIEKGFEEEKDGDVAGRECRHIVRFVDDNKKRKITENRHEQRGKQQR